MATIHSPAGRHIGRWLFVADFVVLFALFNLAYRLRFGEWIQTSYGPLFVLMALVLLTLYVMDVYRAEFPVTVSRLPLRAASGVFVAGVISTVFIYLRGPGDFVSIFGRGVLPVTLLIFSLWAAFSRYQMSRLAQVWTDSARWLYMGSAEKISHFLNDFGDSGVVEVLLDKNTDISEKGFANVSFIGKLEDFGQVSGQNLTGVILALDSPLPDKLTASLMQLRLDGTQIYDLSEYYEQFMSKIPIFHLKDGWFVYSQGFNLLHYNAAMRIKRMADVAFAIIGFLLLFPIVAMAAILVVLDSRGGPVYVQKRTGLNGKAFRLYKLRTMVRNAETDGARWASANDVRITRVGRILRKTRIDELPQLWNVVRGDMSFIGPRPERPEFNKQLEKEIPYYDLRHVIKPGITGWAQVMYPYGSSTEDARRKLEYDLYYIKHYSLILDAAIMLKTLRIVTHGKGI